MPTSSATTIENRKLAERLYDTLMAEIEPELTLANLPLLDSKYEGELKDEHDARMQRYEEAYKKFDASYASFMAEVREEVHQSRRMALKEKEEKEKLCDQTALASIEAAFS